MSDKYIKSLYIPHLDYGEYYLDFTENKGIFKVIEEFPTYVIVESKRNGTWSLDKKDIEPYVPCKVDTMFDDDLFII